jgi:prevent-host-death family protein
MLTVGTRELKNKLGQYLRSVHLGNEVLITVHGRPLARIVPEPSRRTALETKLSRLSAQGIIQAPDLRLRRDFPAPIDLAGKPLSEVIVEERR